MLCFAPSLDRVSREGIVPLFARFHTPTIIGRDLGRFSRFRSSWLERKDDSVISMKPVSLAFLIDF